MHKWAFPDGAVGSRDEKSYKLQAELSCSNIYFWENGEMSGLLWLQLCFPPLREAVELRVRKELYLLCSWTMLPVQWQGAEWLLRLQDTQHFPGNTWKFTSSQLSSLTIKNLSSSALVSQHVYAITRSGIPTMYIF